MKQPSFFIVGAPKSGTTSLCKYLNRHPEIFIPPRKEFRFFNPDIKSMNMTLEKYLSYFTEGEGKICGEGTPSYLRSQVAHKNIYDFNPEAKIIIMLREPVSLLYSWHSQLLFNGNSEDIQDFSEAIAAEADRRQGKRIPQKCENLEHLFYRNVVSFTSQVERYFNTFGREKVHIIIFDDFVKDTAKAFQETLCFLGVNPLFETTFDKKNASRKAKNTFLQRLLKYPPAKILAIGKFLIPLSRQERRKLLSQAKQSLKK